MKAVHSFKSDTVRHLLDSVGGPAVMKPMITVHALSAVTIKQHFKEFVLVTDDAGKELAEICKLPYDQVISVGEKFGAVSDFWIESKMHAYRVLQEPFVHLDNDLFLWEPLPTTFLASDVFAFHTECYLWPVYEQYLNNWQTLCPDLPNLHEKYWINRQPLNMAVFGGNNWQAINYYAKFVQDFAAKNNGFNHVNAEQGHLINKSIAAIEQLWGSYILQNELGIRVATLLTERQATRNEEVPGIKITHLQGMKENAERQGKVKELLDKTSYKLKMTNEAVYNAVERYTSSEVDIDALLKESMTHGTNS